MADFKAIHEFFTDDEWDLIDYALHEYRDHDEEYDACTDLLHKIGTIFEEIHK